MGAINWQQFGLKADPYDTAPLIEGGELPLEKAFVGREREREFLEQFFGSERGQNLAICGDVGVGKTSLANFTKFLWKYHRPRLLFSFRREIEANSELLTKRTFLLEILSSVIREIRLLEPKLLENKALDSIRSLIDLMRTSSIGGGVSLPQVAGVGGSLNYQRSAPASQPQVVAMAHLEECFHTLLEFIKEHPIRDCRYSGLVIHVNNFDILLSDPSQKQAVIGFFNEIRDLLQTPDVYFLFLGPRYLFRDIIASQKRVKSVFYQTPLQVKPLTKTEIIEAFNGRMKLLQSEDVEQFIKPVEDEVVYALYDLYEGDIRSIMAAIRDILGECADRVSTTVGLDEARALLARERWNRIEKAIGLTAEQMKLVRYFAEQTDPLRQKDVADAFQIAQPNVSSYYFKPLKEAGIIEEQPGTTKPAYWQLTWEYRPLKWVQAEPFQDRQPAVVDDLQSSMF